ncbi:hypothetical protein ACA910_018246 [Epithemia clementina (nom. ined.)]
MASTTAGGKGKVLLLHGSRQTGDLLLGRMEKLRKKLEKQKLEIVAPTAPFVHPDDSDVRQWWNRSGDTYEGLLEETFPILLQLWDESKASHAPFVGILGFSQGAQLAHLCCLAHSANPDQLFSGLQFVLMVAGFEAPLPTGFKDVYLSDGNIVESTLKGFVTTPSLHVYGIADKLILPDRSRAVLQYYNNPQIHEHDGGHHVPMRAASVHAYEDFIQASRKATTAAVATAATTATQLTANENHVEKMDSFSAPMPDEETIQLQMDEVEALTAIFPEEFHMLSKISESEDVYEHPIRYQVDLIPSDEGIWPRHPIAFEVQYPHNYPQIALPQMRLIHENNVMEFTSGQSDALLNILKEAAQAEEGMPSVMSCIYAAREFFESGAVANVSAKSKDAILKEKSESFVEETSVVTNPESGADQSQQYSGLLQPSTEERIAEHNLQGLEIARTVLYQIGSLVAESHERQTSSSGDTAHGKGGHKTFTIGLVGKPSAGKSTFFNAATAFARQRDDADNLLGGATMAPHPFTTIDPNIGYCLVPAPAGSCPEDDLPTKTSVGSSAPSYNVGSTHGRDHKGRRLLPVLLKDVAGLVPGAYQGRGRGNKFLNDLTDADVLIHVLDASGTADVEGNNVGIDSDGNASSEASNPMDDMAWIRVELIEWVFSNLMFKWETIKRRGRSKLSDMFGGYGQTQAVTNNVLVAVEKYMEQKEGRERALDHLTEWDEADVHRLVSAFLGVRFPMALALNKCDLPTSPKNVSKILESLPIHGAHVGTPLSSRSEMNFIRYHIERALGVLPKEEPNDKPNERKIPEGVWDCLQSALKLREPVVVFPVADLVSYHSLPGLFKYSTLDPSLPSAGMIRCLEAAGGVAPSFWKSETMIYQSTPDSNKSGGAILCQALTMKPGSTVDDVFLTLKRLGALSGDFVRAEATGSIGGFEKAILRPIVTLPDWIHAAW